MMFTSFYLSISFCGRIKFFRGVTVKLIYYPENSLDLPKKEFAFA